MSAEHNAGNDGLCHEFIDTGRCGHSDAEHDALADGQPAENGLPTCECAMTEASFRACPLHGEDAWCPACREPLIDHASACPIPPATDTERAES